MLVEERVELGRQEGGEEGPGDGGRGEGEGGAGEGWTRRTIGLTRELAPRRRGAGGSWERLSARLGVLFTLVTRENGIHAKLQ